MTHHDTYKAIIECQGCRDSLTIIYSVHTDKVKNAEDGEIKPYLFPDQTLTKMSPEERKQAFVRSHLGRLMIHHLENHPEEEREHHQKQETPAKVGTWIREVKKAPVQSR